MPFLTKATLEKKLNKARVDGFNECFDALLSDTYDHDVVDQWYVQHLKETVYKSLAEEFGGI